MEEDILRNGCKIVASECLDKFRNIKDSRHIQKSHLKTRKAKGKYGFGA